MTPDIHHKKNRKITTNIIGGMNKVFLFLTTNSPAASMTPIASLILAQLHITKTIIITAEMNKNIEKNSI